MARSPFEVMTEDDVRPDQRVRLWCMGSPKVGKSTTLILTAPKPLLVLNCDALERSALAGAKRLGAKFDWVRTRNDNDFYKALRHAKQYDYASVLVDPINALVEELEGELLDETNGDGRRTYPALWRMVNGMMSALFELPCHILVSSHWMADGSEGEGIAPMLPGKLKSKLPGQFSDVVFMTTEKNSKGKRERVFVCSPEGAWGVGTRHIDAEVIPADVEHFIDLVAAGNVRHRNGSSGKSNGRREDRDNGRRDDRDRDYEDDDRRGSSRDRDDEDYDRPRGR